MINKSTENSLDQLQLLENRLRQDILAHKKVLKWEKTIQTRIQRTISQIENLKQHKPKTVENTIQIITASKIPKPSRLVSKKNRSNQPIPTLNNRNQGTESNEVLNDESKSKVKLENLPISGVIQTFYKKNKKSCENNPSINPSTSSIIINFIDSYIRNRFDSLVKRFGILELQSNSNERLIQEVKIKINTISKDFNLNAQEFENSINILKNILVDYPSKNGT